MTIPAVSWSALDADAKRGRILTAARDLFARDGLDAPMPALAAALGVGVGSLYRCYPSKHELIAALMIQRLEQIRAVVVAAAPDDDADAWRALCSLLRELAEEQAGDEVFGRADQLVGGDRRVRRAQAATLAAFQALLDRAKAAGHARADARARDVHLLFASTRAARNVDRSGWER